MAFDLHLPVTRASAVTPHDTNANVFAAFMCGVGGNIAITTDGGDDVTLVGCVAGTIYPIATSVIKSTSTTATSIVGFN